MKAVGSAKNKSSDLTEHRAGLSARKHGICGATFYKWQSTSGGMEASDALLLKALDDEPEAVEASGEVDARRRQR